MKILIVDDTPSIRKMVQTVFEMEELEVIEADCGTAALTMVGKFAGEIGLILLDQMMPVMDGLETFSNLKKLLPDTPVIMLTAHGSVPLATEFMRIGGADFIEKPFHPAALVARVNSAITHFTLQKQLREAELARKAAEAAAVRIRHFLANLSHELRGPLTGAFGLLPFVQRAIEEDDKQKALGYFPQITDKQNDLLRFIKNIQTLARIEVGQYTSEMRRNDLGLVVHEIGKRLQSTFIREHKTLTVLTNPTAPSEFDHTALEEVITQLLVNARQFSEVGGEVVMVAGSEETFLFVSVADTGPGIPVGEEETIFLPFAESTRTASNTGGRGIGLAIVAGICQLCQWQVKVANRDCGGAIFTVTLPKEA